MTFPCLTFAISILKKTFFSTLLVILASIDSIQLIFNFSHKDIHTNLFQLSIHFEYLSMLARIASKFVINRVIQHSYFAESMAIAMLQQPLGKHKDYFSVQDPKKFWQCKFYSHIVHISEKPTIFANQYQEQAYIKACEAFSKFRQLEQIVHHLSEFMREVRVLYNFVEKQESQGNIVVHHEETPKQFEDDVLEALDKYKIFLATLEDKPQWKTKVHQEIGKWFHLIHNNLAESEAKRKIFQRMDRQSYFV